jgi:hypothetical protein
MAVMTNVVHESLDRLESLDLLALGNLGHLVVTRGALPAAFPARYVVEENRVLVHVTNRGERPSWREGDVVTLHATAFEPEQRRGWSVSVTGRAHGTPTLEGVHEPPNAPWIPTGGGDLLEVFAELVEGERLGVVHEDGMLETP